MRRLYVASNVFDLKVSTVSPEGLEALMKSEGLQAAARHQAEIVARQVSGELSEQEAKSLRAEEKKRQPVLLPHARFGEGETSLNAQTIGFSGLVLYDHDCDAEAAAFYEQHVKGREKELGIVMSMYSIGGRQSGFHLLYLCPADMTIARSQEWMKEQIGDTEKCFDSVNKDLRRRCILSPWDYVLYYDREAFWADYVAEARPGKKPDFRPTGTLEWTEIEDMAAAAETTPEALEAWDEMVKREGLDAQVIDTAHNRHRSLLHLLSAGLGQLLSREELMGVLRKRMPLYLQDSDQDCQRLVKSFYEGYDCQQKRMSKEVREVNRNVLSARKTAEITQKELKMRRPRDYYLCPEELRDKALPPALKATMARVPMHLRLPVITALLPVLAALADGVEIEECDGKRDRLRLMSTVIGPQASGKSVCRQAYDLWLKQIREEDKYQLEIEEQWLERKRSRKANERAEPDPMVLVREIMFTNSNSAMLERMNKSQGHTLISVCEELGTVMNAVSRGAYAKKSDLWNNAFDGGFWGQDFVSEQSRRGRMTVNYNWTALGTLNVALKLFGGSNAENGVCTRILPALMPDNRFMSMHHYRPYKDEEIRLVDDAVSMLRSRTGFLDTPRLRKALDQWDEEVRLEALEDDDEDKDTLRRRDKLIAQRAGAVWELLDPSGRESKNAIRFSLLIADYALDNQMSIFAAEMGRQREMAQAQTTPKNCNKSLLHRLPRVFTFDDLRRAREGVADGTLRTMVCRWGKSGQVIMLDKDKWQKVA